MRRGGSFKSRLARLVLAYALALQAFGVWREIEGSLSELPSEKLSEKAGNEETNDELAARRRARMTG